MEIQKVKWKLEGIRIPMEILASQNRELKKEVNQLRKKLKMAKKYKEKVEIEYF